MSGTLSVILAAGLSRRFGADDKLGAPLGDAPLLLHALRAARAAGPGALLCIASERGAARDLCEAEGVSAIVNPDPGRGLGSSVALAADAARKRGAARLLLTLGDTPRVDADLLRAVEAAARAAGSACTICDGIRRPPACFGSESFEALCGLSGEEGARSLLRGVPAQGLVPAPAALLADIDRPGDLEALAR
ncbi:NTP transferase domain-containing protein [Parvularcula oceani]|uniref:NTP transferase domain-containing protein n=1 Tax=Parvularcula oceani TaxID=1247963 RepID=UPI00068E9548|nr:NTP transferase domain-containing protein [Parvularcula oceani]